MDYFAGDQLILPEKGDLLISEPYLPDPHFERTVVYLCSHDENGSFGFVLNKNAQVDLNELIGVEGFVGNVYVGGPVEQDTLHFIHKDTFLSGGDNEIANGVCWGSDFEGLVAAIDDRTVDPSDLRMFIGYSGWSPGQLQKELETKSWIVYKNAQKDIVFDLDPDELWQEVLRRMGGKFKVISKYPLDPRLN